MSKKVSKEYLAGWQAARTQYQTTGGVMPYPPEHAPEPAQEAPKEAAKVGEDEEG